MAEDCFHQNPEFFPLHVLQQLAANDELCNVVREEGGISLLLPLLIHESDAIVRAGSTTLRQVCGSDNCKEAFLEEPAAIQTLLTTLERFESTPLVTEQVGALVSFYYTYFGNLEACTFTYQTLHIRKTLRVSQQVLGLIANLTLRNPEAAETMLTTPLFTDAFLRAVRSTSSNRTAEKARANAAARQGSMAIRNMAVRYVVL